MNTQGRWLEQQIDLMARSIGQVAEPDKRVALCLLKRAGNPYRHFNNQIHTSTPAELVVALFDGALRFSTGGRRSECGSSTKRSFFRPGAGDLTELTVALDLNRRR